MIEFLFYIVLHATQDSRERERPDITMCVTFYTTRRHEKQNTIE